jgi:enoyl-CoA hydratase/carnithine racemase
LPELITELRKPVVAAINGTAVGGGFELALACDLRVAEEHARFALPEAKRGMGAHFASVVLPRLVPEAIAFEMLFTGEFVTAQDAWRWGLLNRLVPTGQAMTTALQLASVVSCKFVE